MSLRELSEEREVGKFQLLRYLLYRHVGVFQVPHDGLHRIVVHPIERRLLAHRLGYEREIFRRDAETFGVKLHAAHASLVLAQLINELLEDEVGLLDVAAAELILDVWRDEGAKLVEGTLEDAVHDFLVEESVRIVNLVRNHRVILRHEHLTLGVEMYDGILCHVAEDVDRVACEAYLSLRCAVRQADDVRLEVGGYEGTY